MLGNNTIYSTPKNSTVSVKKDTTPFTTSTERPMLDMTPVTPIFQKESGKRKVTRQELQQDAVARLLEKRRLIVEWGTGVGKSRVAINAIKKLSDQGGNRFLLFVTETAHKDNWKNEFIEVLGEKEGLELFSKVTVECYNSIHKYEWTNWICIVCDEAHHLRSYKRVAKLSTMQSRYMLCLSATLNEAGDGDKLEETLIETFGDFDRVNLSLQDAIDSDILSAPRIVVHVLELEQISGLFTIDVTWGFQKCAWERNCTYEQFLEFYNQRANKFKNMNLHVTCTAVQGYNILDFMLQNAKDRFREAVKKAENENGTLTIDEARQWSRKLPYLKNEMLQYGSKRKLFLGRIKTRFVKSLIDQQLQDKKFVCFCSDVEQGKTLGGDNVIHAGRKKENAKTINAFNSGDISSIYAIGMIQEGANLSGIEAGLIVQLGGKERVFIQKFGRTMRSRTPLQHIVVIDKTQDVNFFEGSLKNIENMYIEFRQNKRKPNSSTSVR